MGLRSACGGWSSPARPGRSVGRAPRRRRWRPGGSPPRGARPSTSSSTAREYTDDRPCRPDLHQAAVQQAAQVRRHRRLRQAQVLGQLPDLVLPDRQMPQDRQPRRVTQAPEQAGRRRQGVQVRNGIPVCVPHTRRRNVSNRFHRHATILAGGAHPYGAGQGQGRGDDLFGGGVPAQREADRTGRDAVRNTHGDQDCGGVDLPGVAGRSGRRGQVRAGGQDVQSASSGDRDAQCVGQRVVRVAQSDHMRDPGAQQLPEVVPQAADPLRLGGEVRAGQRARGTQADDAGHVLGPRADPVLLTRHRPAPGAIGVPRRM